MDTLSTEDYLSSLDESDYQDVKEDMLYAFKHTAYTILSVIVISQVLQIILAVGAVVFGLMGLTTSETTRSVLTFVEETTFIGFLVK